MIPTHRECLAKRPKRTLSEQAATVVRSRLQIYSYYKFLPVIIRSVFKLEELPKYILPAV